jgi:hypothetical protein
MSHKRSIGKLENKLTRNYCFQNSTQAPRQDDPEVIETVFNGTNENLQNFLASETPFSESAPTLDVPQGTVIHASNSSGYYDRKIPQFRCPNSDSIFECYDFPRCLNCSVFMSHFPGSYHIREDYGRRDNVWLTRISKTK